MVAFEEKDTVKGLGARWDAQERLWYVPYGLDIYLFEKWWPKTLKDDAEALEQRARQPKTTKVTKPPKPAKKPAKKAKQKGTPKARPAEGVIEFNPACFDAAFVPPWEDA